MDGPQRDNKRRTTRILGILAISTLACAILFLALRKEDESEMVSQLTPGSPSHARNGRIYWWENPRGRVFVRSISLSDGATKLVAEVSQGDRLATRLRAVGDWLYFTDAERPPSGFYGTLGEMPPSKDFLGNYLLDSARKSAGAQRVSWVSTAMAGTPGRLRRIGLSNGHAETVKIDTEDVPLQFLEYAVEGRSLYWRKSGSRSKVTASLGPSHWTELPPDCDLMASPFGGGPPRKVASGLTESSAVSSDDGFIFWTMPLPFPREEYELHYLRTADGKTGKIPGFRPGGSVTPFQGKLYWASPDESGLAESINELDPDTQGARSLVKFRGWWLAASAHDALRRHGDRLYCILFPRQNPEKYSRSARWLGDRPPRPGRNLCVRIDPARPQDLSDYRELPARHDFSFWLDGDHIYFPVSNVQQSLFDFAFASSPGDLSLTLHRLPLP